MKKKKLAKILAVGMCMCMCTGAITGCSGEKKQTKESQSTLSTNGELKTLTLASGAELNTIYPLNMDIQNNLTVKQVYECLVNYADGKVEPGLAESWEYNEDSTALTFHLREGVKFHDGTDFNAEAVKIDYEFAKQNPNFGNIKALANAESIEVEDTNTITFHYANPYFAYLTDFCYPDVMAIVSPKVIEEGNYQNMKGVVGTGPYVYKEIKTGEYTKFVKNENYWGEKPYYDEIIVKYIPESASRLQALQNGEIDMIYGNALVPWEDYKQATQLSDIKGIVSKYDSKTNNLVLNASGEKLSDIKVREAVAYAVNKETISDGLTYGNETVAEHLFSEGTPYTETKMNVVRTYDKEKAKAFLDEAGWKLNESTNIREKDGKPLSLILTYNSGDVINKSLVTVLKSQLAEIGINVETVGKDMMTWWKDGVEGKYDITVWNTEQPYTSPHNYFIPMLNRSPHTSSIVSLQDKDKFISEINQFQKNNDSKQLAESFDYLINYSNDNVIDLPLTYSKDMIVYNSKKISGYEFTSTSMFFDVKQIKAK